MNVIQDSFEITIRLYADEVNRVRQDAGATSTSSNLIGNISIKHPMTNPSSDYVYANRKPPITQTSATFMS